MRTHKAVAIAVASLGLMLAGSTSTRAAEVTLESNQAIVPANGFLYCVVKVDSSSPVGLTVTLMKGKGSPKPIATEFGTEFASGGNGTYHFEATAGAFGPTNRSIVGSCTATADGTFDTGTPPSIVACGCTGGDPCPPCLP